MVRHANEKCAAPPPFGRRAFFGRPFLLLATLALSTTALLSGCGGSDDGASLRWLTSWAASHNVRETPAGLPDSTVRMIVRPTASGDSFRVRIENTVGTAPVSFSSAYVGVTGSGAAVMADTNLRLSFDGREGLTLAPGALAWSDPVNMRVQAFQRLAVSLYVASASDVSTHSLGLTTNYMARGNQAAAVSGTGFTPVNPIAQGTTILAFPVYWVGAVDVLSPTAATVVTLGDSITDGRCSTTTSGGLLGGGVVVPDVYQRWTDILADRLAALPQDQRKAVANAGIAGNRVVAGGNGPPALERLDRDVLALSGVSHVIFFEGTNDISGGASAATVIAGMQQVIDRVRARKIKIVGVTAIPRGQAGSVGFTAVQEQIRLEVNTWIRTPGRFDGVLDFDAIMAGGGKSPTGAEIIKPEYNCDNVHPNAAGYAALGGSINLDLLKN